MKFTQLIVWPLGVLALHALLTVVGGYYWWTYVDKIMHTLGGVAIALSGFGIIRLYEQRQAVRLDSKLFTAAAVVSFVCLAAVSWEFLEFTLDHTAGTYLQPSLRDTMGDLLAGLCGGLIIATTKIR